MVVNLSAWVNLSYYRWLVPLVLVWRFERNWETTVMKISIYEWAEDCRLNIHLCQSYILEVLLQRKKNRRGLIFCTHLPLKLESQPLLKSRISGLQFGWACQKKLWLFKCCKKGKKYWLRQNQLSVSHYSCHHSCCYHYHYFRSFIFM